MNKNIVFQFKGDWQSPVPNRIIQNVELSEGARMLWIILRSFARPESPTPWPAAKTLCYYLGKSRDALWKRMKELETARYITKTQRVSANGQFQSNSYTLYDRPYDKTPIKTVSALQDTESPCPDFPATASPDAEASEPEKLATNHTQSLIIRNLKTTTTTKGSCGGGSKAVPAAQAQGVPPCEPPRTATAAAPPATPEVNAEGEDSDEALARDMIQRISTLYQKFFKLKAQWSDQGKQRVHNFFQDHPTISNAATLYVIVDAWFEFLGEAGKKQATQKLYYCKQLQNVNDIFKLHPTHNKVMILGAAMELEIDIANVNPDVCLEKLREYKAV